MNYKNIFSLKNYKKYADMFINFYLSRSVVWMAWLRACICFYRLYPTGRYYIKLVVFY